MIELIKEEIEGEVSYLGKKIFCLYFLDDFSWKIILFSTNMIFFFEKDDLQDECLEMLLPKGKHSDCSEITLEVRPGAGGGESSLFSEEMVNMY